MAKKIRRLGDTNYTKEEARRWAREQLLARQAAQRRAKAKRSK